MSKAKKAKSKTAESNAEGKENEVTLKEQLDKAEIAVRGSLGATVQLHDWWKTHLFRLSWLVLLITFSQCRAPSSECIKNIKTARNGGATISGREAFEIITLDSTVEILSLVIMSFLAAFLSKSNGKFTDAFYMCPTVLIPLLVFLYFQNKTMGCTELLQEVEPIDRPFPVPLIFHTIVTLSYWFMSTQVESRKQDVLSVLALRKTLEAKVEERKKMK